MTSTRLKTIVACVVFATWTLAVPGCGGRAELDAKVADIKKQMEESANAKAKAESLAEQLEKDLAAAKIEAKQALRKGEDADARIEKLVTENTKLKNQNAKLENLISELTEKASSLDKVLVETKHKLKEAEKAKKDAETWEITLTNDKKISVKLAALGNNRYRLSPQGLAFHGVYEFDGETLSMVAENRGYPDLVWSLAKPGVFEMIEGNYLGATMKRKAKN